jgi:hypothetical protein
MKSLVFVHASGTDLDQDLEEWVEIAYLFVGTLPAKASSAKAPLKKKTPGRGAKSLKKK